MNPSKKTIQALVVTVLGFASAVFFALKFPAVEGLGTKVRLPVFHGAMTWATLVLLGALLIVALMYLGQGRSVLYHWTASLRWTIVIMWIAGTVLGFMAAMNTWDFTGSQTPVTELLLSDPRLVVQLVIACFGLAILVLPLIIDSKRGMASADVVFVLVTWGSLAWAMGAGKALHPDSPVMNSEEIIIKLIFFCIVGSHMVGAAGMTALIKSLRESRQKPVAAEAQ